MDDRHISVEPAADDRWVIIDETGTSKPFDQRGDAEARAASRARATGGADLVVKDNTGGIDRRRLVKPD